MKNLIDLTGKTILVTGASSGIGRQTAITLSEVGAKVILTARREEQLKETLEMLDGEGHSYYPFDVCDLENMEPFLKKIVEQNGRMHGLAFCAGIALLRPGKATTSEALQQLMMTNFYSFFELVRQFAKKKYSEDGSKIVAVSSIASYISPKGQGAYTASKAAINASIKVWAKELMPRRISINYICPGMVRSPMTQLLDDDNRKNSIDRQPLGWIDPKDVATMNAYLLSSAADMITGNGFNIDGGMLSNE